MAGLSGRQASEVLFSLILLAIPDRPTTYFPVRTEPALARICHQHMVGTRFFATTFTLRPELSYRAIMLRRRPRSNSATKGTFGAGIVVRDHVIF
jgi:hypothetical protein